MYTEELNKIGLSSNDDKRLPTFDRVTTYPLQKMRLECVKVRC